MSDKKKSKYEKALEIIAQEKGFDPKDFKEYQKQVRYLESKNKYDAIQKPRKGYSVAPGRGAYQYELSDFGGSGSSTTAIKRARQWAKDNSFELPNDLNEDFSKMSPESQDLVDLLNFRKSPSGNFEYIKNKNYKDAYLNHHWAGPENEYDKKAAYYDEQITAMNKKMAIGGYIKGAQVALQIGNALKDHVNMMKMNNQIDLSEMKDPYGRLKKGGYPDNRNPAFKAAMEGKLKFAKGGSLETDNMKNYSGPSHDKGGIPINPDGKVGPNGPEVEGGEKAYKFKDGSTYVFPKKLKDKIEALEKKYKTYGDIEAANTLDLKMQELRKANEKANMAKAPKEEMGYGGKLKKKMANGGNPFTDPMAVFDLLKEDEVKVPFGRPLLKQPAKLSRANNIAKPKVVPAKTSSSSKKFSLSTGDKFEDLANIKSIADTLTTALGAGKVQRRGNTKSAEAEALIDSTLQFDNKAIENKIAASAAGFDRKLRESNRGIGTTNANRVALAENTTQQLAELEINKNNILAGRKAGAAQFKQALGEAQANRRAAYDLRDEQNAAATADKFSAIAGDRITLEKYKNNRDVRQLMSQEALQLLSQKYTNFGVSKEIIEAVAKGNPTDEQFAEYIKFRKDGV